MLYTRNAQYFRKYFKDIEARNNDKTVNINFISTFHPDKTRREKGFANLVYGTRKDIGGFLRSSALNVAADQQAIYELIQNADDCDSSFFSVSYNEDYLLCINNGNYFSDSNMAAIINVGESDKEGEDIGTFGIGFKILHRLVGEDDGLDAIIDEYSGPIIFSWNQYNHLKKFIDNEDIWITGLGKSKDSYEYERDKENPWLVKILYTCFPTNLGEPIRLKDYDTQAVKFEPDELLKMREFLNFSLQNIKLQNDNYLKSGSIFFIKLGKGKHKFIEDGIKNLKSGISYSFNYLNSLKKIYINGEEIQRQQLKSYSLEFSQESQEYIGIKPRNTKRNIKFSFSFYSNYKDGVNIANTTTQEYLPNFYNFFSMDEEKNGFRFLVHCNAFDMNNDRRKLQPDSQINERLLPILSKSIIAYIDNQKKENVHLFYSLYASILLSKEPKNKPNINNYFFSFLKEYLTQNIPTDNSFVDNSDVVKIKGTDLNISPLDIGLKGIEWFYWRQKDDELLINEAMSSEKLGLDKWDIRDILENAELEKINYWISRQPSNDYENLLSELNDAYLRDGTKERLKHISLFKFSNGKFYSIDELSQKDIIFNTNKTIRVKNELEKLGFYTSEKNISTYEKLFNILQIWLPDDEVLFESIANKCIDNELDAIEKRTLFLNFIEIDTKFTGVGKETLKDLKLFSNLNGSICNLKDLISDIINTPTWLNEYKIDSKEYFKELHPFLLKEEDLYQQIILPNWNSIIDKVEDIASFYDRVKYYYTLNENNTPLKNQTFIYINDEDGFLSLSDNVFYNSKLKELSQYQYFQGAVESISDLKTPNKIILPYLSSHPFKIDDSDLLDQILESANLDFNEVKSLITFCKLNNEQFFKHCIIEKNGSLFDLNNKREGIFQISSPDSETRRFIDENCSYNLIILPYEFKEFNMEEGIIRNDDLHNLILNCVNIEEFKDQLVDIVKYQAKYELIIKISEFIFSSNLNYTKDDYEYKILNLACTVELKERDIENFKEKLIIETESGERLKLSDIPPFADKIQIDGKELSLAKILPESYQNSSYLSSVINCFVNLDLPKDKLELFFGINETAKPENVFALLSSEYTVLENEQQLAFLLLYDKSIEGINFSNFEVKTCDERSWQLVYSYYIQSFSFIGKDYLLKKQYSELSTKIDLPFAFKDKLILNEPFFEDGKFICPCIKNDLTDEEKIDLVEFILSQWRKDKSKVEGVIDWTEIEDDSVLGFVSKISVYPSKYALDEEQLPLYIVNWIGDNIEKIQFLTKVFKVWVDNSTIVDLRKFYLSESNFVINRLSKEPRFNDDERMLFNTFEWLKANSIQLQSDEQFEVFKKSVEKINSIRSNNDLIIQFESDFEMLTENSAEWDESYYNVWKEKIENRFSIYLYNGKLPVKVVLDEISDYIFYRYNSNNVVLNDSSIFINSDTDINKNLSLLVAEENDFTAEDLLLLYQSKEHTQTKNGLVSELQSEIERLKQRIADLEGVSGTVTYNATVTFDTEYHNEIKEKSERYLFNFLKSEFSYVNWLNYDDTNDCFEESWGHHDFEILDDNNEVINYIDCKGTPQYKNTFYLTNNEWDFFLECSERGVNYQIYRVYNVMGTPNHTLIDNLWKWLEEGKVVPYLSATETIKGGRVFLTIK